MSDFTAVFLASTVVMLVVLAMFLLTLKKAMDIEKMLK
ncbi:hypothetical protein GACE_2297 [Geoglobus acetivorans]|uniref:Uncharacterized protein n=1 Tax=Geoglobus acetivorans TaxID=565033 RepID=A0A0A7GG39_GEOAI|nr:hypothetical protein GACE_2297 [Geoglobus acetivorans]